MWATEPDLALVPRKAKVAKLDGATVDVHIFELDVKVHDLGPVEVVDRVGGLQKVPPPLVMGHLRTHKWGERRQNGEAGTAGKAGKAGLTA